jgi:peptide chain release factor subunit 1
VADQLQEAMDSLRLIESPSLPILSVYLDLAPERIERRSIGARLRDLLDPIEKVAASGDLGHESSMSLRAGVEHILAMTPVLVTELGSGVAMFVCDGLDLDRHLTMPRGVWDSAVAGPRPYLRPIQAVLDEYRKIATVVLDVRSAEMTVSRMGEILDREVIEAEELRKSNLAGWHGLEERRHRQHAEEARNHMFREVAERLSRLRRDSGVDLVLVGGQTETTSALIPFLEPRLQEMTQTFVIDLTTLTPSLLATRVSEIEETFEREEEARQVEETYAAAAAGDLAVVGVERVLRAVNRHAVARLLLHDSQSIPGSMCRDCGALSLPADICAECGGETTIVPELFDSLSRSVVDSGGSVEHVMSPTRLADDLIAARLRFVTW